MSGGQRALWIAQQLSPGTSAYNVARALRVTGDLDRSAVDGALRGLIERHPALRTTLSADGDTFVQRVHATAPLDLVFIDAEGWSDEHLREAVSGEANRPFRLEIGPLFRAIVFSRSPSEHVLLLSLHHTVTDFWSLAVLSEEFGGLYGRHLGEGVEIPPAPTLTYLDWSRLQSHRLSGPEGERLWTHWRSVLAGPLPQLALPTDRSRPRDARMRGASAQRTLDSRLTEALKSLARARGTTLFSALIAGYSLLLRRWTGQTDLVIGTPTAGRHGSATRRVVGYFVNPVPLRVRVEDGATCVQHLASVEATVRSALAHGAFPFSSMVERLAIDRRDAVPPVFQTMFVFQRAQVGSRAGLGALAVGHPGQRMALGPLMVEAFPIRSQTAQLDLNFAVAEVGTSLSTTIEYDTDLFDAATIDRLLSSFELLLCGMCEAPEASVDALPVVPKAQLQQLQTLERPPSALPLENATGLHHLFEVQARRTPERIAVDDGNVQWSYAELRARSSAIAKRLQALGIGPGALVGVRHGRSAQLVATLLGVLKSGAAYLPIDPAYPDERVSFMLQDAKPAVLVVDEAQAAAGPCPVVHIQPGWFEAEARSTPPPTAVDTSLSDLAYVLYTSGSTGRPKGTALQHGSALQRMAWVRESFSEAELQGVLAGTSICFDLSVFEIFGTLSWGGTVIIAANALMVAEHPAASRVTLLNTVPSVMAELLSLDALPRSIRTVLLAGEALAPELARRVFATGHVARLGNLYGPTEDTTYSTASWLSAPPASISIGTPLPGTRAYVLDSRRRRLPIGVPGELYLGGAGLARGYLNRPELTAERFVPDPFSEVPGARMYATGDRVRVLASGEIEYLGRLDHQVKIRGFRIELDEIQRVLATSLEVQQSVVVAREIAGAPSLVAYVVPAAEGASADSLKTHLRRHLPEYMVPAHWALLPSLPLTPNGKVDRRALPSPTEETRPAGRPLSQLEERVARLWSEVLGCPALRGEDDFFAAGGHSLSVARVRARVRAEFGIDLPMRAVFDAPTVTEFARLLDGGERAPLTPLLPASTKLPQPLSSAQLRMWLLDRMGPPGLYNISIAVDLRGPLDVSAFERALNRVARRQAALRTRFVVTDGTPYQAVDDQCLYRVVLLHPPTGTPDGRGWVDAQRRALATKPFDLLGGPLLRVHLWQLQQEAYVAQIVMHHIISDGWSLAVFVEELADAYVAERAGRAEETLAPLAQYTDFASWHREWLQTDALEAQLRYWRTQLSGPLPLTELPPDGIRSGARSHAGAVEELLFPLGLLERVRAFSLRNGVTPFMTLLSGWLTVLHRHTGEVDLTVATPVAGRPRAETERLIGFFVNTLLLRTRISPVQSFGQLVRAVKTVALEAYSHQDLPIERLIEALQPEREAGTSPLFSVFFALQNAPRAVQAMGELTFEQLPEAADLAKFDLALILTETPDGLLVRAEYATELYRSSTIRRVVRQFGELLCDALDAPERPISQLRLMAPEEEQSVLAHSRGAWTAVPAGFLERFEQQAAANPAATALVADGAVLSYGELERQSRALALRLQQLGVGPDVLVGVAMERSVSLAVGVLAVLRAGGAYVALDPSYPQERLKHMLEETRVPVVITTETVAARLPACAAQQLTLSASSLEEMAAQGELAATVAADHLAYVLYTSGSTGVPKGIAMTRRALDNLIAWQIQRSTITAAATAQFASINFDVSFQELFATWGAGGRVELLDEELRHDPAALLRHLHAHGIERLFMPFTPLQMVSEAALRLGIFPHALREVITAGEQVRTGGAVSEFLRRLHPAVLDNQYGPSETHVATAHLLSSAEVSRWDALPPIGTPLQNVEAFVLDDRLQVLPAGVTGDLYLGGEALARGYLGRPGLTADRFVPHPFAQTPGARLYRTGDRARWRESGELEFIGRLDDQVKIRGHRVELGEVEAVLDQHPDVAAVAVVAVEAAAGSRELAAYVVPREGATVDAGALHQFARARLPGYLVPSSFGQVAVLPKTPSGKVDRRSLARTETIRAERPSGGVGPRTPTEETIAAVWCEVLRLPRAELDVEADFFECGGHSLLAMQLAARLEAPFGREIPVRLIFEARTIAGLARALESSTPASAHRPPLLPRASATATPLSFAQQRLWFLEQFGVDAGLYTIAIPLALAGELDHRALSASLNALRRRHEVLRTRFESVSGRPVQVVAPPRDEPLDVIDLRDRGDRAASEALKQMTALARESFSLDAGPLMRARLWRVSSQEHYLLVALHHAIADGWSMGVLIREVSELYEAAVVGREPSLPRLKVHYGDYAVWQRDWLQGEVLERQFDHWRKQLAGTLPVLELPTDRPRGPRQTFRGAIHRTALGTELVAAVERFSRDTGATSFMTLLSAFQVLLHRMTGAVDLCIGTPVANRRDVDLEPLVGFFVNTLVLRTDLDGTPTFRELVGRVRAVTLEAYANQDLPFEVLVERLQPERSGAHPPLFQVLFALQNAPTSKLTLPGVSLRVLEVDTGTAKFDLSLLLSPSERGLEVWFEYNSDLFEPGTIAALAARYERLLAHAVAAPDVRITSLLLLDAEERAQLRSWSQPERPAAPPSFLDRFSLQARQRPDAAAVVEGERILTYAELNARANRLSAWLRAQGIGVDARVGICLERGVDACVAVLATLKAGAAYVPFDPTYPADRLTFMHEESAPRLVLTRRALAPSFPAGGKRTHFLEELTPALEALPPDDCVLPVPPQALGYILYTSGSTGRPKGVAMGRGALNALIAWQLARSEPALRTLQFASLNFDVSFQEMFATWCSGGTLQLISDEQRRDPLEMIRLCAKYRVQRLFLPYVVLHALCDASLRSEEALPALREVITAGEQLRTSGPVAAWFHRHPLCRLDNQYGPTETHVVTALALEPNPARWAALPAIGRPQPHAETHVLDGALQPVPVGVVGELYLGGDMLARGYLNRPALTAERFLPDPYARTPGTRMYRTGDLVRWRKDGLLEFVGRADYQTKIRGFRVEVSEVEAVLAAHPTVEAAAVEARGEGAARRLVAFVVPGKQQAPERGTLLAFLRQRLPEYMVPADLLFLPALPLTPSGKLDRRALPEVASSTRPTAVTDPPRTPLEQKLAALWSEVLGVERVGRRDNFFELGGHSLLATQLTSRVREMTGREVPVRLLFDAPTLEAFAVAVEAQREASSLTAVRPELAPGDRSGRIPLSYAQQRLWFLEQLGVGSLYHLAIPLRFRGPLDVEALRASLRAVVTRHEALRTSFHEDEDGEPYQQVRALETIEAPLVDLAHRQDAARQAEQQLRWEIQRPFDLTRAPLVRARLWRTAEDHHTAVVILHHIVADGWSLSILRDEILECYRAARDARTPQLPELTIQYGDYARWQQAWLQGPLLQQQLAYWRKHLGGDLPILFLPTDFPRPARRSFQGATYDALLDSALLSRAEVFSREQGVSLFMTLLTAFQVLLSQITGRRDLVVGTPIANRTHTATEPLIGFFVNMLPLRTQLLDGESFQQRLARTREATLGAYAHQEVPFQTLVETLRPEHPGHDLPLFQVVFALQNVPLQPAALDGVHVDELPCDTGGSKFDLSVLLTEREEGLAVQAVYSTELFEPARIAQWIEQYAQLLERALQTPDVPMAPLEQIAPALLLAPTPERSAR